MCVTGHRILRPAEQQRREAPSLVRIGWAEAAREWRQGLPLPSGSVTPYRVEEQRQARRESCMRLGHVCREIGARGRYQALLGNGRRVLCFEVAHPLRGGDVRTAA